MDAGRGIPGVLLVAEIETPLLLTMQVQAARRGASCAIFFRSISANCREAWFLIIPATRLHALPRTSTPQITLSEATDTDLAAPFDSHLPIRPDCHFQVWVPYQVAMVSGSGSEILLPSALDAAEEQRRDSIASFLSVGPFDTLNGRYRPFRKLGEGQHAAVWLARDTTESQYVAIKIGVYWMLKEQGRELCILQRIKDHFIPSHPGSHHVLELKDALRHQGPRGTHACLVSEPLGRRLVDALLEFEPKRHAPYPFTRKVAIQTLQALDYLHQLDIMHGDIHLGNLVLRLTHNINTDSEANIRAKNEKGNELERAGEEFHLDDQTVMSDTEPSNASIVLIDLGAAITPADSPNFNYAYPLAYRAPEVVVGAAANLKADIWALGCAIYRIVSGQVLYPIEGWGGPEATAIEQLYCFIEMLGPMAESVRALWADADSHVAADGTLLRPFPEDERELPLDESIRDVRPGGMGDDELEAFVEFMGLMMRFDPAERKSTSEILRHRWVTDFGME